MKKAALTTIIIYITLFMGCSPQYQLRKNIDTLENSNLVIMEPLFLSDIKGINNDEEQFNSNCFVGTIVFSGGIVTNEKAGMVRQSEKRTFENQEKFRGMVKTFYLRTLKDIVRTRNLHAQFIAGPEKFGLETRDFVKVTTEIDRERYEEDGQDNINLPRLLLTLDDLQPRITDEIKKTNPTGTLIVPVVEYYYGHDGGWFNDQEWGCAAGARMSFHLYAFDIETGRILLDFRNVEKNIIKFRYQVSHLEMSKELYKLELEMTKKIKKVFP